MQEIALPGGISLIRLPNGWVQLPSPPSLDDFSPEERWERTFMLLSDSEVKICFLYRGRPVDSSSAAYFRGLLASRTDTGEPEKLSPIEVSSLQLIMGLETAGNNQYTNCAPPATPEGPVFDLKLACIRRFAGRSVLFARGVFRSGRHYAGIFFDSDASGQIIEEAMLQAPSLKKLDRNMRTFEQLLDGVKWQKMKAPM